MAVTYRSAQIYQVFKWTLHTLKIDVRPVRTYFQGKFNFHGSFLWVFHMAAFLSHDEDDDILNRDDGGDISCDVGHDDDDD